MQKHELLHELKGFMDETDIVVRFIYSGDIRDIVTVNYVKPSFGEPKPSFGEPAFVCLVINGSAPQNEGGK